MAENLLNEAPCVCWTYVYGKDENGGLAKVNITMRGADGKKAFDELMELEQYADKSYGFSMYIKASTSYSSASKKAQDKDYDQSQLPEENVKYEVTAIVKDETSGGKHNLKIRGGNWQKFGQTCWVEKVPEVLSDFVEWKRGTELTGEEIPVSMTYAIFDPNKKKIIGFSET